MIFSNRNSRKLRFLWSETNFPVLTKFVRRKIHFARFGLFTSREKTFLEFNDLHISSKQTIAHKKTKRRSKKVFRSSHGRWFVFSIVRVFHDTLNIPNILRSAPFVFAFPSLGCINKSLNIYRLVKNTCQPLEWIHCTVHSFSAVSNDLISCKHSRWSRTETWSR